MDLDTLLQQSDYVSLHHRFVEGAEGNDEQFGRHAFGLMKPTAFFVNTARGRMVDEEALCDAIEAGDIAGAALDVFRYEPLPRDHRFFSLPPERMILTPHLAGVPMRDAADTVVRQIASVVTPVRGAGHAAQVHPGSKRP
jgi:phosphoglycerate dehydrogenase-like enzyme